MACHETCTGSLKDANAAVTGRLTASPAAVTGLPRLVAFFLLAFDGSIAVRSRDSLITTLTVPASGNGLPVAEAPSRSAFGVSIPALLLEPPIADLPPSRMVIIVTPGARVAHLNALQPAPVGRVWTRQLEPIEPTD
jgi:hypothetical protein